MHYSLSKSWPMRQALSLLKSLSYKLPKKGYVLFETGYGPSGLPHIGTFSELVITSMVRKAFEQISNFKTVLYCVSDDMDGLRKVPDNIPNKNIYLDYIDMSLSSIPSLFDNSASYADYMNNKFKGFMNYLDCDYIFVSSSSYYKKGRFNHVLKKVLCRYDEIMSLIIPTLSHTRRVTYSIFLPICPKTNKVLQVKVVDYCTKNFTITYIDESSKYVTTSILDGKCKLQWKVDFPMRWVVFNVDYEIYGKDIDANAKIYNSICKILGGVTPSQMSYELFLDRHGKKISKSKGNGISIDQWRKYSSLTSLKYYIYISVRKSAKISFDNIPNIFDEYLHHLVSYKSFCTKYDILNNPIFFLEHSDKYLNLGNITYTLLLNLIIACNTSNLKVIWGYIIRYECNLSVATKYFISEMLSYVSNYYNDFVKPSRCYKKPDENDVKLLLSLVEELQNISTREMIQTSIYNVLRNSHYKNLKIGFQSLYSILLGTTSGPRLSSFIKLYGVKETIALIKSKVL